MAENSFFGGLFGNDCGCGGLFFFFIILVIIFCCCCGGGFGIF